MQVVFRHRLWIQLPPPKRVPRSIPSHERHLQEQQINNNLNAVLDRMYSPLALHEGNKYSSVLGPANSMAPVYGNQLSLAHVAQAQPRGGKSSSSRGQGFSDNPALNPQGKVWEGVSRLNKMHLKQLLAVILLTLNFQLLNCVNSRILDFSLLLFSQVTLTFVDF